MLIKTTKGRVLGFDIENMPLTYYAPDYPTTLVTVIGMAFEDSPKKSFHVCILDPIRGTGCSEEEMMEHFLERYDEATLVTGHYIRKHDLPTLNGALWENDLGPLSPKMTSDTKDDLKTWRGLPKNLEYLVAAYELESSKVHLTQRDWRQANTFTKKGLEVVRSRSKSDVMGQLQLRQALISENYLDTPKLWRP